MLAERGIMFTKKSGGMEAGFTGCHVRGTHVYSETKGGCTMKRRVMGAGGAVFCWLAAGAVWGQTLTVDKRLEVAEVWAGCPVGFAMLTHSNRQFLAFYSAERVMTLAERALDAAEWTFTELPSRLGWDSHNYVTMAVDAEGYLHVSGNMHCVPLVYFRSARPMDSREMIPVHTMTGALERRVTYPIFMKGPDGALLFTYRDGGSGNGSQIWNRYDVASRRWSRLLDVPLFDGQGKMNAYPKGPVKGKDGYYHLTWVWRDTPACETCHNISYIRSRDLVNWENAHGRPVALPLAFGADVVVDAVPVKGGLINPCQAVGLDGQGRVVVTYTKYDAAGNTQLMNARFEHDAWKIYQTSDWDYRWEFSGGGTIIGEIGVGPVELQDGALVQGYSHAKLGGRRWRLDEATLKPVGTMPARHRWPSEVGRKEHPHEAAGVRTASDLAADPETGVSPDGFVYRAVWESLPANRDRPQPGGVPEPARLRVYKLRVAP